MKRELVVTWTDPAATLTEGRQLLPIEHLRAIRDGRLPDPPFARLLGLRLAHIEDGEAAFELTPGEQHYNPIGTVHGGVAFAMLDSAMGCAVHTRCAAGKGYTTLEIKVNLVRAVTGESGALRASAKVVHFGSRTATAEGRLEDAAGRLYAHGSTTCLIVS